MQKKLDPRNILIFQQNYPYLTIKKSTKPFQVTLGIGGNIGDVSRRFNHLFYYLKRSPFVDIVETSAILKNPPFGYLEQDDFQNALIIVKTCLHPKALLRYILRVEKKFGRKRSFSNAPRTLDIDMIFYEKVQMNSKVLTLPHSDWMNRTSVIIPLIHMKTKT
ncbi:MAG: 2-amino-4-hydroxy-6-hydroxymethyldihydropteridinepyrophosphokinase (EC [uncultured Sulfurovum sp.]|uniref:2-amino-4-hydroxy-6-hydroxymethyldihydropteridine pyrophosphokinase n=1 Tax=uncultured Sulfurovum sp. TaxID=269237 RepID=A0A6S6SP19_9BACT|nr:MAG: 2-amino-4-hydroxy-6-hydroxymethyldihydropteridinepyrophosphokinase (EC [uncultured Sulfurovum sp.]